MHLKGFGWKRPSLPNGSSILAFAWRHRGNPPKSCQDYQCPDRYSKQVPPEYRASPLDQPVGFIAFVLQVSCYSFQHVHLSVSTAIPSFPLLKSKPRNCFEKYGHPLQYHSSPVVAMKFVVLLPTLHYGNSKCGRHGSV